MAHVSQVTIGWWDIGLEHAPPDLLASIHVFRLLLPLHLLSNRLGPSVSRRENPLQEIVLDTHRLKALSNFPKSIFLEIEVRRVRLVGEKAMGSVTSTSSSSDWEIGWYSERFTIVEEVKESTPWDATRKSWGYDPHTA